VQVHPICRKNVLDPQTAQNLSVCHSSNDTVQRSIEDIATDVEVFRNSTDESTDVSDCAILFFMHCMGKEDLREELLCCINLPGRTKGQRSCWGYRWPIVRKTFSTKF